jgi:hypothetical protein
MSPAASWVICELFTSQEIFTVGEKFLAELFASLVTNSLELFVVCEKFQLGTFRPGTFHLQ